MIGYSCTPDCWTPVKCGVCGRPFSPIGRSVPLEATGSYCDPHEPCDPSQRCCEPSASRRRCAPRWGPGGLSGPSRVGQDDRVPVLDLSPRIVYRRARGNLDSAAGWRVQVGGVLEAARWAGTVLAPADILGSVVVPVVSFTGARERVRTGQGPMLDLETLDVWETMPTDQTPAAPLRIVGFIATATRWSTAVEQVRSLAGLGAGLVVTGRPRSSLSLLDADATGVWVVGVPPCEPEPRLWVTGRVGPAATATRVTATRLMEEALFAHALDCWSPE